MPAHSERHFMPFSQEQLFGLVADVERYPEFLPWCVGARLRERSDTVILAELMIGFKMYRERFTSRVVLSPPDKIQTNFTEGPFRYLENQWVFTPAEGGCVVDFEINFEFKSRLLQRLISVLFNEAVRRMVTAFESRARALYGPPRRQPAPKPLPARSGAS